VTRAIIRRLLDTVLAPALATIAVAAGLLTDSHRPVYLIAAGVLVVIGWRWRSPVASPIQVVSRLVLALVVVSEFAADVPPPVWPLLLAGVILIGLLQVELVVSRVGRPLYRVANLPVPPRRFAGLFDRRAVSQANTALLAAFIIVALAGWPSWPLLLAAAGAAAVTFGTALASVRLRLLGRGGELARLRQLVSDHRPTFMVYFTAPPGSTYQLMMWLPHLEQIGEPFVVVLREPQAFDQVAQTTRAPVLYTPEISTFDACMVDNLRAVFYVNNGAKNTHCVRYGELTHVFLNHGDSDKVSSFNPVAAMYDRVFVAGQAGIDRYLNHDVDIPPHRFRIVGRPQVAPVRPAEHPVEQVTQPVVLYAPTWRGHYTDANYSSLPIAILIVQALLARGVTIIVRHHPYSARNRADAARLAAVHRLLATDQASSGRQHRWGLDATVGMSLIDCFNESDALIGDVSSVASEYLFSEKPFAIADMAGQGERFVDTFPLARVAYVIDPRATNVADVLDRLLKTDPSRPERLRARVHYLGDFPRDGYADAFVAEARRSLVVPSMVHGGH
jgi:hypothetical protein